MPTRKGNSNVEKMMKNMVKLRAMKALAIGVASAFALMSEAATQKVGNYTYSYGLSQYGGTTGASIQPYIEPRPTGKLILPDELGGYPVRSIGQWALCDCVGLTEVTLPSSLTTIGHWAFTNCTSLTAITIPDNVNTVYDEPFLGCSQLAKVDMPSSLDGKVSKDKTFPGCRWNLTLYYRAKTADATFYYREPGTTDGAGTAWIGFGDAPAISPTTITSVKIPSELNGRPVQRIDDYSFKGCTSLTSVTIPDSVKWIGRSAFQSCSGLTSVMIPASVTSIGDYAFKDCSSLKTALLPVKMRGMNFNFVFTGCADGFAEKYFCKVIFDGNGGTSANTICFYEDAVGPLWTPTRDGYNFLGWFTEKSGGTQVTASTQVTADVTYYAHWQAKTFTVTFNATNGKLSGSNTKTVQYNKAYGTLPTATQAGYDFLGWFTERSGGTQVTATTKMTTAANHTLYSHWKRAAAGSGFTVTFNATGGSVSPATRTVSSGATVGTLPTPTQTGYDFKGWWTAKSGGTQVTDATKVTANMTYYAHWQAKTFTVTFVATNGKLSGSKTKTVQYNKAYGTLPTATQDGYDFIGWFTERSGGTQVTADTKMTTAADHTLYSHWRRAAAMVAFNGVGTGPKGGSFAPGELFGAFADGGETFALQLDEGMETAYLVTWTADGDVSCECEAEALDDTLVLTTEDGVVYRLTWSGGSLVATRVD